MAAAIHWNEDGQALNDFLDECAVFVNNFSDSQRWRAVSNKIVSLLCKNRDVVYNDPLHPFNRFGNPERSRQENIRELAHAVMEDTQEQSHRSVIRAFFHSNGSAREDLDDLMDFFFDFVDESYTDGAGDEQDPQDNQDNQGGQGQQDDQPIIIE